MSKWHIFNLVVCVGGAVIISFIPDSMKGVLFGFQVMALVNIIRIYVEVSDE